MAKRSGSRTKPYKPAQPSPDRQKLDDKRREILARLVANPSEQELRQMQLHIDTLEKFQRLLAENHHDDVGAGHEHHDHSALE